MGVVRALDAASKKNRKVSIRLFSILATTQGLEIAVPKEVNLFETA